MEGNMNLIEKFCELWTELGLADKILFTIIVLWICINIFKTIYDYVMGINIFKMLRDTKFKEIKKDVFILIQQYSGLTPKKCSNTFGSNETDFSKVNFQQLLKELETEPGPELQNWLNNIRDSEDCPFSKKYREMDLFIQKIGGFHLGFFQDGTGVDSIWYSPEHSTIFMYYLNQVGECFLIETTCAEKGSLMTANSGNALSLPHSPEHLSQDLPQVKNLDELYEIHLASIRFLEETEGIEFPEQETREFEPDSKRVERAAIRQAFDDKNGEFLLKLFLENLNDDKEKFYSYLRSIPLSRFRIFNWVMSRPKKLAGKMINELLAKKLLTPKISGKRIFSFFVNFLFLISVPPLVLLNISFAPLALLGLLVIIGLFAEAD